MLFRERIVNICSETSPLSGEIEVDESYLGATRVRGKRGRGARGKSIKKRRKNSLMLQKLHYKVL